MIRPLAATSLKDRIESRLDRSGDCWLWIGSKDTMGYGLISYKGRRHLKVHRAYLEAIGRPVPEGLTVDHLCRVRHCCNPDHLEAVTQRENVLRGIGPAAINARKTHCIHGHEFTPENTKIRTNGGRDCRACISESGRRYRAKKRAS